MTDIPAALQAHLAGETTTLCHCWRLTRADGAVFGFTDHDRALAVDGTDFLPETGLTASEARESLGLAVDTVDVEGALSSLVISEADLRAGLYDGATVETLLVNWAAPEQAMPLRRAVIGRVTQRDGRFVAELESEATRLDGPRGRIVARACDAELGDARCGVDLGQAGFHGAGSVAALRADNLLVVAGLEGFDADWFSNGLLTWTDGGQAGRGERVLEHRRDGAETLLALWAERAAPPAVGDGFTIVAGCDKRFATCREKFTNTLNFRGFPHLPGNDAGYGYVAEGGAFDGGPIVP